MKLPHMFAGVFLVLLSALGFYGAWGLPLWAEGQGLGSGAFPLVVSTLVGVLGLAVLAETGLSRRSEQIDWPDRAARVRIGAILGGMAVYALLTPWLGFTLTTALVTGMALKVISPYRPTLVVGIAIVFGAIFWFTFVYALGVSVPTGPLGI